MLRAPGDEAMPHSSYMQRIADEISNLWSPSVIVWQKHNAPFSIVQITWLKRYTDKWPTSLLFSLEDFQLTTILRLPFHADDTKHHINRTDFRVGRRRGH
jgi:hypothetical protein